MRIKIDPLDKIVSEYIRKRACGYCERCRTYHGWQKLQASHFYGRGRRSVRYDPDNLVALCFGCHQYFRSYPLEYVEWVKNHLGDRAYDLLSARMRVIEKPDINGLTLYFRQKISELEANP